MSHDNSHDGDHGGHDIHLPDPSPWPLIVGVAALFLGLALIWWSRERDNAIAGPLLGAAAIFTLISAAGWAYEDGKMRKKADEGELKARKAPRFTQVITFTIAEGAADAARAVGGVLPALETSESVVKDLGGFQDFRVTVSPGNSGPLQVLAETTWSDREGLNTYDAAQKTLLDVINSHNEEIIPGSVQAFDMEVVRDTKETAFSLGRGAVLAMLGSFVVGGFMIGAGLTLFGEPAVAVEGGGGGGEPTAPADPFSLQVNARDNVFDPTTLTAAANADVSVTLVNRGAAPHNITFYQDDTASTVIGGEEAGNRANGGETVTFNFDTPGVGSYFFHCDFHPDQMTGTLNVIEAEAGAEAPAGGEGEPEAEATTAP